MPADLDKGFGEETSPPAAGDDASTPIPATPSKQTTSPTPAPAVSPKVELDAGFGKPALTSPEPEPDWAKMSIWAALGMAGDNFGPSWKQAVKDTVALAHEEEAQKGLMGLLDDFMDGMTIAAITRDVGWERAGMNDPSMAQIRKDLTDTPFMDAIWEVYNQRYNFLDAENKGQFKKYIATDPVGFLSDLAIVIPYMGGAGKAKLPANAIKTLQNKWVKAGARVAEAIGDPGGALGRGPGDAFEILKMRRNRKQHTNETQVEAQKAFTDAESPKMPNTVKNPTKSFLGLLEKHKAPDPAIADRLKAFIQSHKKASSLDDIAQEMMTSVYIEDLGAMMDAIGPATYIKNGIRTAALRKLFDDVPKTWTPDGLSRKINEIDPKILSTILGTDTYQNLIEFAEMSKRFKDPNRFWKWVANSEKWGMSVGGTVGAYSGYMMGGRWESLLTALLGAGLMKAGTSGADWIAKNRNVPDFVFREPVNWADWTGTAGKVGRAAGQVSRKLGSDQRYMKDQFNKPLVTPAELRDPVGLLRGNGSNLDDIDYREKLRGSNTPNPNQRSLRGN